MSIVTREFPSSSSDAVYTAKLDTATGEASCTCRGWTFKRGDAPRSCRHTRELASTSVGTPAAPAIHGRDGEGFAAAATTRKIQPMLASAMGETQSFGDFESPEWMLEEKFDGHRLIVHRTAEGVSAHSRPRPGSDRDGLGRELPAHIAKAAHCLPVGIYDGELYIPGGTSSDVVRLERQGDLRLALFDVLEVLGQSTTHLDYTARRAALALAVAHCRGCSIIHAAEIEPVSLEAVKRIWSRGGEGAILKRASSTYRVGYRSKDWVKIKTQGAAELTIIGFEAGSLGPHAVTLLRADDGIETSVKTVNNATLAAIAADPAAWIGRRLVISHNGRRPSGKYRHPMWDHLAEGE